MTSNWIPTKTKEGALMKRRVFALLFACMMLVSSASATGGGLVTKDISERSALTSFSREMSGKTEFGGMFFEGDTLVIAYVGASPASAGIPQVFSKDYKVVYRPVTYPLWQLEAVKDYLAGYMYSHSILTLDASERENTVVIGLKDYSEENIKAVTAIVEEAFGITDYLRFEDCTGQEICFTVSDTPIVPFWQREELEEKLNVEASQNTVVSGMPIQIDGGWYTFGPATSSKNGYSAGHGFSGSESVYTSGSFSPVGTAFSHFGGSNKDWSSITASYSATFAPVVQLQDVHEGDTVHMLGAVSGFTEGEVLATNQTVPVNIDGVTVTLTGMCSATYSSDMGDSGGAIFDSHPVTSSTAAYGVQSAKNTVTGISYFTPLTDV